VATTRRTYKGKVYCSHLLRRTFRDGPRVRHETLGNLSHLSLAIIEIIRRALRGETFVPAGDAFEILRARPHGHVAAVLGMLRRVGLEPLLSSRRERNRDLVTAMIVARILEPRSKLATAQALWPKTLHHTLAEVLDLGAADEDELYAAMDGLLPRQARIEAALAKRHLAEGPLVLYDVTSVYFEGRHCPLARRGHDRDQKKGKLQIVVGLLCDAEGCPVAVEVFAGNTGDPTTLPAQIQKLRERFGLTRVIVVGDRGMITEARIRSDLRGVEGLGWITALRAPAIQNLVEQGEIQLSLFDEQDLAEIQSDAYPGERLVVCKNPFLQDERARKREDLLRATEKELDKIVAATLRPTRRLKGRDRIGRRVGKVEGRFKVGKHFLFDISDDAFRYERDQANIAREAALDGFYVIRTNVPSEQLNREEVVRSYKRLSKVERGFRSLKTVDLKIRPIHHRLEDRVRAHVLLCMLAYYVEWHLRKAWAPILFDDPDPPAPDRSPVKPATRSKAALAKAATKSLEDGTSVQSFQNLLRDLATLTKNTVRAKTAGPATFEMLAQPTPLHRRAFELLNVPLTM
jgi:hypothetical protein